VLLQQSIGINKSLFVLRKVIAALAAENEKNANQVLTTNSSFSLSSDEPSQSCLFSPHLHRLEVVVVVRLPSFVNRPRLPPLYRMFPIATPR
jgi:hypothetical protein